MESGSKFYINYFSHIRLSYIFLVFFFNFSFWPFAIPIHRPIKQPALFKSFEDLNILSFSTSSSLYPRPVMPFFSKDIFFPLSAFPYNMSNSSQTSFGHLVHSLTFSNIPIMCSLPQVIPVVILFMQNQHCRLFVPSYNEIHYFQRVALLVILEVPTLTLSTC